MEKMDTSAFVEEETSIDFRHYIALFSQWWWIVVIAMALAGVISFFVTRQITPVYRVSSTVLVNEAPSTRSTDYTSLMTSERVARTYAQMMTKRPILDQVSSELGVPVPDNMVTAAPVRDTQLLTITVEHTNPVTAADIANKVLEVFSQQIQAVQEARFADSKENLERQIQETEASLVTLRTSLEGLAEGEDAARDRLEARLSQTEQIYSNLLLSYEQVRMAEAEVVSNLVEVERAVPPTRPVRPSLLQNTLLAVLVGLFVSAGGLLAYDMLDDTIVDPEEVTRRTGLPVLGMLMHSDEKEGLVTRKAPRSPVAEAYRALRTNVQYAAVDKPVRALLVTSPAPSDGKTTVAANLAVVMAQGGRNVTIIDADMHRPRQHRIFDTAREPGLSGLFMQSPVTLNGAAQALDMQKLRLVAAGSLPPNPSELLGSNKMREILETVLEEADVAIIDTPPVLSLTDALVLAPLVDGVLLVIKPGETKRAALKQSVDQLRYLGVRILGVVLNDVGNTRSRYGHYYKNYYYRRYYRYYDPYTQDPGRKPGKSKKSKPGGHQSELN